MGNVSFFSLVFTLASETSPQCFGASAAIPSHPKVCFVYFMFIILTRCHLVGFDAGQRELRFEIGHVTWGCT